MLIVWGSFKLGDCLFSAVKGAEATLAKKFWPKNLTPYFFGSNRYLQCIRACCENFFKIVCVVSEKIGKEIPTCDKVSVASMRSCLQFE